jgi:hypothetical protein
MGPFDQTGRQAAKDEPADFFVWLLPIRPPLVPPGFGQWDDTRRASWPGGPERTDDLVAIMGWPGAPASARLIVEVKAEPDGKALLQVGVYELLLAGEVGEGVQVGSVLLHLTGAPERTELHLGVPGVGLGHHIGPEIVNLCERDAPRTLRWIETGELGRCVLPWLALLRGGGDPGFIEDWKRVVEMEPDPEKRARYRAWALVFAELSKQLVNWQKGLEGWMMQESQVINGWIRTGEVKGELKNARESILRLVRRRLVDSVPEDLRLAIEGTNDPQVLSRWFDAALDAETLDQFRAAMRQAP